MNFDDPNRRPQTRGLMGIFPGEGGPARPPTMGIFPGEGSVGQPREPRMGIFPGEGSVGQPRAPQFGIGPRPNYTPPPRTSPIGVFPGEGGGRGRNIGIFPGEGGGRRTPYEPYPGFWNLIQNAFRSYQASPTPWMGFSPLVTGWRPEYESHVRRLLGRR